MDEDWGLADSSSATRPSGDDEHGLARTGTADLVRAALLTLALVVVVRQVFELGTVVSLLSLGVVVAFLTEPARRRCARMVGEGAATAIVAIGTFVAVVVLGAVVLRNLAAQTQRLADALGGAVSGWQPGSWPAELANAVRAEEGIRAALGRVAPSVVAGEATGFGVGRRIADVLLIAVLAAFVQGASAMALTWFAGRWPRSDRQAVRQWVSAVTYRAGCTVRRALLLAVAVAGAVAGLARLLDLPGWVVLGAWAGVWIVVPLLGTVIGLVPFVAVGFVVSDRAGAAAVGGAMVVAVASAVARRRLIDRPLGGLPVPVWTLAFGVGSSVGGLGGALVAVTASAVLAGAHAMPAGALPWPPRAGARPLVDEIVRVEGDHTRLVPGVRGAVVAVAVCVAAALVWMLVGTVGVALVWLVMAALVAIALDRPTRALVRTCRVGRPVAATTVLCLAVAALGGATVLAVRGAARTGGPDDLPDRLRGLEDLPLVGDALRRTDVADRVGGALRDLLLRVGADHPVADWLPTVGSTVVDVLWAIVLAVALVYRGPSWLASMPRVVPARQRRQAVRIGQVSLAAISGYVAGAVLVAALNATFVFVVALALGVVLAPVLAIWAFVWNFVPQVGGFMGGLPLVVLALAVGPGRAIIAAALFVTYQFVENHVIAPAVIAQAIDVPAWATLLAALAGGAMGGAVGAIVLTPLVGVVHRVVGETRRRDLPGQTVSIDGGDQHDAVVGRAVT